MFHDLHAVLSDVLLSSLVLRIVSSTNVAALMYEPRAFGRHAALSCTGYRFTCTGWCPLDVFGFMVLSCFVRALGSPPTLWAGVEAMICGHSTCRVVSLLHSRGAVVLERGTVAQRADLGHDFYNV